MVHCRWTITTFWGTFLVEGNITLVFVSVSCFAQALDTPMGEVAEGEAEPEAVTEDLQGLEGEAEADAPQTQHQVGWDESMANLPLPTGRSRAVPWLQTHGFLQHVPNMSLHILHQRSNMRIIMWNQTSCKIPSFFVKSLWNPKVCWCRKIYPGSIIAIRTVDPNDEVYMIGWKYRWNSTCTSKLTSNSTQLTSIKIHSKFNMTFMKTNRNPWKLELHETVHWSWRNHRIHRSLQIFTNHPYVYGHLSWFHMISMSFKWPATIITGQAVAVPLAPIAPIGQGAVTSWQLGRTWSTCSWGFGAIFLGEQEYRDLMMGYKHALGGVDTLEIVLGRIPHSYIYMYIWTYLDESYSHLCTFEPSTTISYLFWTCFSLCGWVV